MQEDDGFSFSAAPFGVVERLVRREARRGEHHPVGLAHGFPPSYPHGGSILTRRHDAIWSSRALLPTPVLGLPHQVFAALSHPLSTSVGTPSSLNRSGSNQ
jgi:hypothetical protein